jgi:hypothetical protein
MLGSFAVSPNPFSDKVVVQGLDENVRRVDVVSAVGQHVGTYNIKGANFNGEINLEKVQDGLYLLVITKDNNQTYTYRIIKNSK